MIYLQGILLLILFYLFFFKHETLYRFNHKDEPTPEKIAKLKKGYYTVGGGVVLGLLLTIGSIIANW